MYHFVVAKSWDEFISEIVLFTDSFDEALEKAWAEGESEYYRPHYQIAIFNDNKYIDIIENSFDNSMISDLKYCCEDDMDMNVYMVEKAMKYVAIENERNRIKAEENHEKNKAREIQQLKELMAKYPDVKI